MKRTITKITVDTQSESNLLQLSADKLILNFNKSKNKLTFAFVLLTGLVFGQTVQTYTVSSSGGSFIQPITYNFSTLTSSTNFTLSFEYQTFATPVSVTINDGTSVTTNSLLINNSFTGPKFNLVINKTTLNSLVLTFSGAGLFKNLIVEYTTGGVGINELKQGALNIDMYCHANTLYIKNTENISNVKLEIYNLSGQLVLQENNATKPTFDLNLPKGIYTARVSSNGAYKTNKIIIE